MAGNEAPMTSLWVTLYSRDEAIVSHSLEKPKKTMIVIITVCPAFGLTILEAKTSTMCSRTTGITCAAAIFSVKAASQIYKQEANFLYLGENVNYDADLSTKVDRP